MSPERRDEEHLFEFKRRGHDVFSEGRKEIFEAIGCFLDYSMVAKASKNMRDSRRALSREILAQVAVSETEGKVVALRNGKKHGFIFGVKDVEAPIAPSVVADAAADFLDVANTIGWIVHGGEKFDVPTVTGIHDFRQIGKTVDGLPCWGCFVLPCSVPMFHPSVVFKGRDVIAVRFDAENTAELVIHLDTVLSHVVSQAVSFDACRELAAQLSLEAWIQTPAQKHGQIIRFHGMSESADQLFVNRGEGLSVLKEDIRSVFDLHKAPMNTGWKVADDGGVLSCHTIQCFMQQIGGESVGQLLGLFKVVNVYEGVVDLFELDAFLLKLTGKEIVCVAIELKSKGSPCRHAQIAEPEILIDEIEVVVKATTGIILEKGFMRDLIMPGLERCTRFHGREDVDQARLVPPLFKYLFDAIFFAEGFHLSNKLNSKIIGGGHRIRMLAHLVAVNGGPFLEIEDANPLLIEKTGYCMWMADVRQRTLYNNAIITGQRADNALCMTFRERNSHGYLLVQGQLHLQRDDTRRLPKCSMAA